MAPTGLKCDIPYRSRIADASEMSRKANNESASTNRLTLPGRSTTTNRFKASGIVATAVQPSKRIRKKHHRKSSSGVLVVNGKIAPPECNVANQTLSSSSNLKKQRPTAAGDTTASAVEDAEVQNAKQFVKKVKTKIKKKKSGASKL